ncbi:MAG: helix-turn-helix transcriptional regulator [Microthrixaceae bacterium]|nr:helix-turn-helix transcriptional regulator [Microthrixaceae bacterium]
MEPESEKHTSAVVGANVRRLRTGAGMTIRDVVQNLRDIQVPMSPSGVTDIEKGRRGVTVDQLTALAIVFNVSPATLLTPHPDDPDEETMLSACIPASARDIWLWMIGEEPSMIDPEAVDDYERETFRRRARPEWVWKKKV